MTKTLPGYTGYAPRPGFHFHINPTENNMSKIYSKFEHTHVMVAHPDKSDGWDGPQEIALHTGKHVWVPACYSMQGHTDVIQVGIGGPAPTAYDEDGNCILAVPAEWCEFLTPTEAEGIVMMQDADDVMLGHMGRNV